ncbi:hypothetical protein [Streptomyces cinnamoneus]|uniref:Hydrogenase expression protein HypF n=1 Tax=Streptomyces cinnamoneus TaxID=53446 RepID=A0A918TKC0_STRCJ|nr:hypothetical protein [Streptomyces cinnamoneus]GHC48794.1 hypothetical protein GCM10010507_25490 [Streptomyces cinnamoneus]
MPTEEEPTTRARCGPRHAAPRKPLLARLQMPAGTAIALVAMPSAVLMGMGLTPTLAEAKPVVPPGPFGDAQCATAPDAAAGADATEKPEPGADDASPGAGPAPRGGPSPAPSGTAGESKGSAASRGREPAGSPSALPLPVPLPKAEPTTGPAPVVPPPAAPSASPSPSPTRAKNPLDPLGLGDKLSDLLNGGRKVSSAPSTAPSTPAGSSPAASPSSGASAGASSGAAKGKAGAAVPAPGATPSPGASAKEPGAPGATPPAGPSGTPSPGATASPGADPDKPPLCPPSRVLDENEKRAFPNQPWYLEASKLTLKGLTYEGVKRITMVNGQQKPVLKFTADALEIKDLHQIVNNQGKQYHVTGTGTTSTVSAGKITMYTEELKGKLLGVLPSTQSPSSLPPLIPGVKLPIPIFFTDVKIRQAGQYGGTLHIPNLHQYLTEGTYS